MVRFVYRNHNGKPPLAFYRGETGRIELWMMYDIRMYIQYREWDLTIHMATGGLEHYTRYKILLILL